MRKFVFIALFTLGCVGRAQGISYAPLFVFTSGDGSTPPLQSGQSLEVGQSYSMEGIASPGYVFSSWQPVDVFTFTIFTVSNNATIGYTYSQPSPVPEYTYEPVLEFTMQPEILIDNTAEVTIYQSFGWQVNFVPVPEPSSLELTGCGLAAILFFRRRPFREDERQNYTDASSTWSK
jgi:hypothetical protein